MFGKISTAVVTPFCEKGQVDFEKTTKLINYLIENGSDSLVISGTTGESPTLTVEEKVQLFRHAVKIVDKRVPVIAGTGSNDTQASIELTQLAEQCGVDAVMLVTPYYNKPSQEGIFQHFKAIAEVTKLPVMIYNVPGRTVAKINPETAIKLSTIPNIVALKDAGGSLDAMTEVIANTENFHVYSGDDSLTLPALAVGAVGVISVASHVIGNEMQQMIKCFEEGNTKEAAKIHQQLVPKMNVLFSAPNPVPVKIALNLKGIDVGGVRLPLIPLTEQETNNLRTTLGL